MDTFLLYISNENTAPFYLARNIGLIDDVRQCVCRREMNIVLTIKKNMDSNMFVLQEKVYAEKKSILLDSWFFRSKCRIREGF